MSDGNVTAAAIVIIRRGEDKKADMELVTPDPADGKFSRDTIQRLIEKLFVTAGAEIR